MTELRTLLVNARHAQGDFPIFDANDNVRGVHKRAAAHVARHSLRTMEVPAFAADALRIVHTPLGAEASKRTLLSDTILAGSRCHAAGARIVIIPTPADAVTVSNGELIYTKRETRFDVIEAAEFALVPDGDELTDSDLPVFRQTVDLDTMPSLGVRIPLSRTEQKAFADGQLADATIMSIALGVARAADQVLLAGIVATNPPQLNPGLVATSGLAMSELRGLVGRDGKGAMIWDGDLVVHWDPLLKTAAGIASEFTPDTAATVVGSFNRCGIACSEDITLIAERIDTQGSLTLTAWINMQALLPMPGAFWTVEA